LTLHLNSAGRSCDRRSAEIADRRFSAALLGLLGASLAAPLVLAQTASQITPPTFRPEPPRLEGALVFSGQPGLEAPPGAERLSVTISGVAIEGALPEMAEANSAFEQRLLGRPVALSEIFAAAQELEAAYAQAGLVLTRVVLPEQTLRDGGALRLVIVSGFVERIDVANVRPLVRPRIERVTQQLVRRPGLTLEEIERQLLIAGDAAGVALRSALAPGAEPGGTVITLEAEHRPVTGFVGTDNTLSDELGTWSISTGLEINSLFRQGEMIYLRAAAHPELNGDDESGGVFDDDPRIRSLAAGLVLPLGTSGLTFGLEAVQSNTTPELAGGIDTASEFRRLSFSLQYPWIRSRAFDLRTEAIFDAQTETLDLLAENQATLALSEDDLRILRLATEGEWRLASGAVAQIGGVLSVGLDSFGARSADDASPTLPLSRQGADAEFAKLDLAASYSQPIAEHLVYSLYGRGQTSFGEPLVRSEQIGIASFSELSTFDAGSLGGDSGWVLRADLLSPWSVNAPRLPLSQVTPYVFGAIGELYLAEPSAFEEDRLRAAALGVGLDLSTVLEPGFSGLSLTVEYGRAFRDDDISDENRFTFVGSFRF
jgi:hemolysin activation/secretion protein